MPIVRRIGAWVIWWTVLMGLWVWIDDSIALAELLAGAAVAAMAALFVELICHQSASRFRVRIEWLAALASVPADLAKDTALALNVLWRRIVQGIEPESGFRVLPIPFGDDSPEAVTRRALLTAGRSITPNTFVVGLDQENDLMVIHQLVVNRGQPLEPSQPSGSRGENP